MSYPRLSLRSEERDFLMCLRTPKAKKSGLCWGHELEWLETAEKNKQINKTE